MVIDHRELLQNTISAKVVKFRVGLSGRVGQKKGGLGWEWRVSECAPVRPTSDVLVLPSLELLLVEVQQLMEWA